MQVEINHSILSDSPYDDKNDNDKSFLTDIWDVNDLVQDITTGKPSCYLISGYRGVGKSSFIRYLEKEIDENSNTDTTPEDGNPRETIFVCSNFAKYHNQNHLLRKLIRSLYLQLSKSPGPILQTDLHRVMKIEDLFKKTFFDTSDQVIIDNNTQHEHVEQIEHVNLYYVIVPFAFFLVFLANLFFHFIENQVLTSIAGMVASIGLAIVGAIKIRRATTITNSHRDNFSSKSLYDDEIADHFFTDVLASLKTNYRIIFVLDELDKVEDKDMADLLKEMKSYLVSGLATFIVVAGQKLYFSYLFSHRKDDAILSTIFSKSYHVSLFTTYFLKTLFHSRIAVYPQQLTNLEKQKIDDYLEYLIYKAKRVPRKFISLIRQEVEWNNKKPILFIQDKPNYYKNYRIANNRISSIEENVLKNAIEDEAVRDFMVMQFYLLSDEIFIQKQNIFTLADLLTNLEKWHSLI